MIAADQRDDLVVRRHWDGSTYSVATFSTCERYRFNLVRFWDVERPRISWCLLNPSTATESKNDPTVERCQRRSAALGFGSMEVVNLFALRSTDPRPLHDDPDPYQITNRAHIIGAAERSRAIVCGWGKHGAIRGAGRDLAIILRTLFADRLMTLGTNLDGSPKHPLYVGYDVQPVPWIAENESA